MEEKSLEKEARSLVSVLISAYNHEKYIEECIDSIINQSYENIELIILNDGSTDRTSEKIKLKVEDCKRRFKRFLFIDKKNEGVAKTLNNGLFKSKGKFLTGCASDDSFTKNAIEIMCDFLENNPEYVLAVGDNYFIDEKSKRCYWNSMQEKTYNMKNAKLSFGSYLQEIRSDIDFYSNQFGTYESLLKGNYIPNGYLIRNDILINKVGGFSEKKVLEDFLMHLQLSKFGKYKYINKHLYNYRWHKSNTVKQKVKMFGMTNATLKLEKEKYADKFGFKRRFDEFTKKHNKEKKNQKLNIFINLSRYSKKIFVYLKRLIFLYK